MRAAVLREYNAPLELMDLSYDRPSFGQVEVKLLCSGICGAQLQEISGQKKGGPLPHLLGHEGCGIVESVGNGVTTVKDGDKVVLHWRKGDGIQSELSRYRHNWSHSIGAGSVTTFNEMAVVSENRCTAVPMDAPDELCALLGCGLSTALGTIEREANLLMGESILIIGCGGLGLNLILAAKLRQAGLIAAIDTVDSKRNTAFTAGADVFGGGPDILCEGKFDVIIDTSGSEKAFEQQLPMLAPSGRFIMVGQPKTNVTIFKALHLFEGEGKTIKATQGGGFRPSQDIPRYIKLWRTGALDYTSIVTDKVMLEDINEGIDLVRNGDAGRVLVSF